jgi:hypothetical protein
MMMSCTPHLGILVGKSKSTITSPADLATALVRGFLTQENLSRSKAKFPGNLRVREVPDTPRLSKFRDGREIFLSREFRRERLFRSSELLEQQGLRDPRRHPKYKRRVLNIGASNPVYPMLPQILNAPPKMQTISCRRSLSEP